MSNNIINWNRVPREILLEYLSTNEEWNNASREEIIQEAKTFYDLGVPLTEELLEAELEGIKLTDLNFDVLSLIGGYLDYNSLLSLCASSENLTRVCSTFTVWIEVSLNEIERITKGSVLKDIKWSGLKDILKTMPMSDLKLLSKSLFDKKIIRSVRFAVHSVYPIYKIISSLKDKINRESYSEIVTFLFYEKNYGIATWSLVQEGDIPLFLRAVEEAEENKQSLMENGMIRNIMIYSPYISSSLFIYALENLGPEFDLELYRNNPNRSNKMVTHKNIYRFDDESFIYLISNGLLTEMNGIPNIYYIGTSEENFNGVAEFRARILTLLDNESIQEFFLNTYPLSTDWFLDVLTDRYFEEIGTFRKKNASLKYLTMMSEKRNSILREFIDTLNSNEERESIVVEINLQSFNILVENGFVPNEEDISIIISSKPRDFMFRLLERFDIDLKDYGEAMLDRLKREGIKVITPQRTKGVKIKETFEDYLSIFDEYDIFLQLFTHWHNTKYPNPYVYIEDFEDIRNLLQRIEDQISNYNNRLLALLQKARPRNGFIEQIKKMLIGFGADEEEAAMSAQML